MLDTERAEKNRARLRENRRRYRASITQECSVSWCSTRAEGKSEGALCAMHERRLRVDGDLGPPTKRAPLSGPDHARWKGDDIQYVSAHSRVRNLRGSPSQYPCIDCVGPAQDWSYNRQAERELIGESKYRGKTIMLAYSANPDDYDPRCRLCHSAFDRT